jgi:glycine hydroxymethyltransferase
MHVIAAKAVAFKAAAQPEFKDRQQRTLDGARLIAERLTQPDVAANGVEVLTGGTEVHLVLVDLRNAPINGQETEDLLHEVGITVNRNSVPNDPRPPMVTSGPASVVAIAAAASLVRWGSAGRVTWWRRPGVTASAA